METPLFWRKNTCFSRVLAVIFFIRTGSISEIVCAAHLGKFVPVWPAQSALSFWSRIFEIAHLVMKLADFRQTKPDRDTGVTKFSDGSFSFAPKALFAVKKSIFRYIA